MAEGKIRIPDLEGTPEEIAQYKRAFSKGWEMPPGAVNNLMTPEEAAASYAEEAAAVEVLRTTVPLTGEIRTSLHIDLLREAREQLIRLHDAGSRHPDTTRIIDKIWHFTNFDGRPERSSFDCPDCKDGQLPCTCGGPPHETLGA
jgi:hypothetical protein